MNKNPTQVQTYNDGIANIYSVENIAKPGNMKKDGLKIKVGPLRYEERTVGISRFYYAKQADARIDRLIRTPKRPEVSSQDVAVLSDGQYEIKQVQYPKDAPMSMDLSLERLVQKYDIA